MPTSLTCGFVFASRGYPQVYRVNVSVGYQNCVMHATQGWRTATLQHAAGFGNLSRLSPRCSRLPYRSPTQLPDQLLEYRRGTAGPAVAIPTVGLKSFEGVAPQLDLRLLQRAVGNL